MEVENGEEIFVAGYFKGSEIWAQAWWNKTTGMAYEPPTWFYWPSLVLAVGLLALGILLAYKTCSLVVLWAFLFPIGLVAVCAGSACYRRRAIDAIRTMKTQKGLDHL